LSRGQIIHCTNPRKNAIAILIVPEKTGMKPYNADISAKSL
jgi:hypothetical protein